jgi:hypothetical protein
MRSTRSTSKSYLSIVQVNSNQITIYSQKIMKLTTKLANILLLTATLMTAVSPAFAENPTVTIGGTIAVAGSGCPEGSASATVSPDGQELSILFDKFAADATKPAESRKSCNLAIPIKVPQGFQISLSGAEYSGYVSPNTTGKLRSESFFAGQKGPVFSKTLDGGKNYTVKDSLASGANVWSACGDSVNMRVNTSMIARGKGMATIDSMALANGGAASRGLIYHIKYRACTAK